MLNYQRVYFMNYNTRQLISWPTPRLLPQLFLLVYFWKLVVPKNRIPVKKEQTLDLLESRSLGNPLCLLVNSIFVHWPRILAKFPELSQHPQVTAPSRQCSAPAARCPVFSHESGYFPRPPGLTKPLFMGWSSKLTQVSIKMDVLLHNS